MGEYTEADQRADTAFLVGVRFGRESERAKMLAEGCRHTPADPAEPDAGGAATKAADPLVVGGDAATFAELLRVHESRWTTHGNDRLYEVIHCAGPCDWSLRQKALMTDEDCYEAHREHVGTVLAARLDAVRRKAGDERAEQIAQAIDQNMWQFRRVTRADAGSPICRAYDDAARIARESR